MNKKCKFCEREFNGDGEICPQCMNESLWELVSEEIEEPVNPDNLIGM